MIILTADLATCTGYAYGRPDRMPFVSATRAPKSGEELGVFGAHYFKFFRGLLDHLQAMLEPDEVIHVLFEAPILPPAKWDEKKKRMVNVTTIQTIRRLHSLGVILESVCEMHSAPTIVREASLKTIKRELTGSGNADKADMIVAARRAGVTLPEGPEAADGADAFAIWILGCKHWAPQHYDYWLRKIHGQGGSQERMSAAEARRLL